jgi:predicted PurR-regulated permease PerM
VAALAALLKKLPLFLLTVLFTLMTTLMVSWDYAGVTGFLSRQLPPAAVRLLHRIKAILAGSVLRLAKAYLLLFLLTLAELSLGLWLLGVKEFFVAALAIALLDLLPVVGSGLVLGSWSAIVLAGKRIPFGIGLLVLWVTISLVRALLEPKIVGDQIGLHPLVTLTAMYFGLRTAGVMGMLVFPLLCMVAVRLQADGSLKFYK